MLRYFIENKHYIFVDKVDSWQDAIKKSCIPLVKSSTVTKEYQDEIIKCIEKYGAYIVVKPGIAIPHAQESSKYVKDTAISFMKLSKKIYFDDQNYADLFFTLASCDSDKHLENMQRLVELLRNKEIIEKLHKIKDINDLKKLSQEYNI